MQVFYVRYATGQLGYTTLFPGGDVFVFDPQNEKDVVDALSGCAKLRSVVIIITRNTRTVAACLENLLVALEAFIDLRVTVVAPRGTKDASIVVTTTQVIQYNGINLKCYPMKQDHVWYYVTHDAAAVPILFIGCLLFLEQSLMPTLLGSTELSSDAKIYPSSEKMFSLISRLIQRDASLKSLPTVASLRKYSTHRIADSQDEIPVTTIIMEDVAATPQPVELKISPLLTCLSRISPPRPETPTDVLRRKVRELLAEPRYSSEPKRPNADTLSVLFRACRSRNMTAVHNVLVNNGFRQPEGSSVLHYAVRIGDCRIVQTLLDAEISCFGSDLQERTPLYIAADENNVELAELLLQHATRITGGTTVLADCVDTAGVSPLHVAASRSSLPMVQLLLRHRATIVRDSTGRTPLDVIRESVSGAETKLSISEELAAKLQDMVVPRESRRQVSAVQPPPPQPQPSDDSGVGGVLTRNKSDESLHSTISSRRRGKRKIGDMSDSGHSSHSGSSKSHFDAPFLPVLFAETDNITRKDKKHLDAPCLSRLFDDTQTHQSNTSVNMDPFLASLFPDENEVTISSDVVNDDFFSRPTLDDEDFSLDLAGGFDWGMMTGLCGDNAFSSLLSGSEETLTEVGGLCGLADEAVLTKRKRCYSGHDATSAALERAAASYSIIDTILQGGSLDEASAADALRQLSESQEQSSATMDPALNLDDFAAEFFSQ